MPPMTITQERDALEAKRQHLFDLTYGDLG